MTCDYCGNEIEAGEIYYELESGDIVHDDEYTAYCRRFITFEHIRGENDEPGGA